MAGVTPHGVRAKGRVIGYTETSTQSRMIVQFRTEDGEERDWGYTTASDPEDLLKRVSRLVKGVTAGGHCCAFVYTQM
jgi:hypothetical protein